MFTRVILFALAALCVTMNVLVWRAEFGSRGDEFPVPEGLVWRKIMTAPEASSLNVYQGGKRTGFCEFSTSVEQEMAQLDESRPPPEGFINHAGYQLRITGNASLGDFTNRVKFDGHLEFAPNRAWRSLDLHVIMHGLTISIVSLATNKSANLSVTSDGVAFKRTIAFADLQDPNRLLRSLADSFGAGLGTMLPDFDFPAPSAIGPDQNGGLHWDAIRTRYPFGHETVPIYRLETRILDRPIIIIASPLGEILRVELPGNTVATLDEWSKE